MRILKLDISGRPVAWLSREEGALLYCRRQVAWEAGLEQTVLRGGVSRLTGRRSRLTVNSIVATTSLDQRAQNWTGTPALTNAALFRRDEFRCMYCGSGLPARLLTRDHIVPRSAGGEDTWENVVAACRPCNHRKDNQPLQRSGLRLLAVPYAPNRAEGLILENRRILADQMAFLRTRVGASSRLRVD
ncbi:MAG: HNH endonuclease [Pseudomonadota bacterium]